MNYISVLVQHHAGSLPATVLIGKNKEGVSGVPQRMAVVQHRRDSRRRPRPASAWEQLWACDSPTPASWPMVGHKQHEGRLCGAYRLRQHHPQHPHSRATYHVYYEAVNTWQAEPPDHRSMRSSSGSTPPSWGSTSLPATTINFMAKYDPWTAMQTSYPDRSECPEGGRYDEKVRIMRPQKKQLGKAD